MNLSQRSMGMNRIINILCVLIATIVLPQATMAEELSEQAKIEALIQTVESLTDAKFVRNGSDYNAKSAAKFLRSKWDSQRKEVNSAEDFIAVIATRSSTTGKPYLIRPKNGAETPCADFLKEQLKRIEAAAKP
ncbi:MAG: hypothetical protein RLZZ553_1315 [Verrucomicrobiota bacterium]